MARSVRVASCFFLVGMVLLLPSPAVAMPPTCLTATLVTPVNTRLVLGAAGNPCSDPDGDTYTVALTMAPAHGTLAPDGSYYDPAPGFHNVDFFSYQATDSHNEKSAIATITIVVDSAPVCSDGSVTTSFNHAVTFAGFPCTDIDGSDEFTVIVDDGDHGTVTVDPVTGDVNYLPAPGFVGTDSFPFWAEDDFGQTSPTRSMTVTVTSPPAATPIATPVIAPPPPPDRAAPAVTLKNATAKQAVSIIVTSSENASATLTLTLDKATARKLKLSRTVGTLKTTLTAGKATLSIKLSAKARKVLKRVRRVKLTLTAVVTDAAGNKTTRTLALTLKK